MLRHAVMAGVIFMIGILIVPALLVTGFGSGGDPARDFENSTSDFSETDADPGETGHDADSPAYSPVNDLQQVAVFRSASEMIEDVPMEEYIAGVVASEMPASYEMEALKAQALTARTYLIRQLMDGHGLNLPTGADVTDTEMHQVYKNENELKELWGSDFDWRMSRIRQAVYDTEGQVITYEGEPITATFFSTSNGYTENSEEYWENEIPYLKSTESLWDLESPRYAGEKQLTVADMEHALGVTLPDNSVGMIIDRTTGGSVATVEIGGSTFTGREIREALKLDSSDFDWTRTGDTVTIQTRGWGHGVGMSQYGAHAMAAEGHTYRDIIHHYYYDVTIEEAETVLVKNQVTGRQSG